MKRSAMLGMTMMLASIAFAKSVEIPQYIIERQLTEACVELVTVTEERRAAGEKVSPDMAQGYYHIIERHEQDPDEATAYCEAELEFYEE